MLFIKHSYNVDCALLVMTDLIRFKLNFLSKGGQKFEQTFSGYGEQGRQYG